MIRITQTGVLSSPDDIRKLAAGFDQAGHAFLPGFLAPPVLQSLLNQLDTAPGDMPDLPSLFFILNRPRLFELVEQVSGAARIGAYIGSLHRIAAGSGRQLDWHDADADNRMVGIAIGLSTEEYSRGVFQFRDTDRRQGGETGHLAAGDAILFRIGGGWQHRMTRLESGRRAIALGWFREGPGCFEAALGQVRSGVVETVPGTKKGNDATLPAKVEEMRNGIIARVGREQAGVRTWFDDFALKNLGEMRRRVRNSSLRPTPATLDLLNGYAEISGENRLVPWFQRNLVTERLAGRSWNLTRAQRAATQGVRQCLSWRGRPLFKSVFDFAMYPMLLWELRPATIIELGSGTGASAIWFADLLDLFETAGKVYSLDLKRIEAEHPRVTFLRGDGRDIESVLRNSGLEDVPHPWLVVEDMHVNTLGVLRYFATALLPGDYIVIEDSGGKRADIAAFDQEFGAHFKVDSHYTDFFGRNSSSGIDSIFVRV